MNPVMKLFLATTGESKSFEAELAQSFGPEEAHRIVYSDELCMGFQQVRQRAPPSQAVVRSSVEHWYAANRHLDARSGQER